MSRSNIYIYNPFGRMSSVLTYLFVSSTIVHVVSSVLTSSVVILGTRVELNCSISENDSVVWRYTSWNSSRETDIYLGIDIVTSMRSRYKIHKNISGQHNLIIDPVDFDHAGRYECTGTRQQSILSDIQLTVLGSPPACSANTGSVVGGNTERGYLQMWCHIIYAGNTNPNMTWTKDNTNDAIIPSVSTASDSINRAMPLTHTSLVIRQLQANDNGATFKCKTTFQLPSIPEGNKDDYEYTWSYKPYGPSNLSIVQYEDRLECSAEGNPIPTYRWTRVVGENFIEGSVLILNRTATTKKDLTFQCIATNLFGSVAVNFSTSEIFISADKKSVWSMNALGLVLLIAFLTVLGILILITGIRLTKLSNNFDEDKASVKKTSFQSKSSSKRLDAPQTTEEVTEMHRADMSDNYCALTDRSTASQQPTVYCELRSYDQQSVKPSTSQQKTEYKDREYANVGLHETQL